MSYRDFIQIHEGEGCADAVMALLPDACAMTSPGGCKAVKKAEWTGQKGIPPGPQIKVKIFPDWDQKRKPLSSADRKAGGDQMAQPLLPENEQPGMKYAESIASMLVAQGNVVSIATSPPPGPLKDGRDIKDMTDEGCTVEELIAYLEAPGRLVKPDEPISTPTKAGAGRENKGPHIPGLIWGRDGLKNCLSNVYQLLAHRPEWSEVVGYDEFALCIVKRKPPPYDGGTVGEWDSTDDSRTAMWLAQLNPDWTFTPSSDLVAEAVEVLGRANAFHPVREYLASLTWDETPRLEMWLEDYLGVARTEYSMRVAKWWLMGAVKRVLQPGCKFDYCLVLEGPQGKGKSTALRILGRDWFGDTDLDLSHKDSMSALRGKWVYEIAELGALARSEEKRQKSFLSRTIDEYRPVYGRREIKAPRQLVFGGSTNEFEWNKDPTGGRRFWPVECHGEFNLDGLREVLDQMYAEALALVEAGVPCHPSAEEQRTLFDPEQLKVEQQDSLVDAVHDWVWGRIADFSIYDVAADCLKLDASKLTRDLQTRLGIALRKLGCTRIEKRNGMIRYWYKPPVKNEASSKTGVSAQHGLEVDDVDF